LFHYIFDFGEVGMSESIAELIYIVPQPCRGTSEASAA
jgi:hypothetical protein